MHVCGQTLVLVDNDSTVSEVNRKVTQTTLKYMFYHQPGNRTFCLSDYGHDVLSAQEFSADANDLAFRVDGIGYGEKDSNLCDTLAQVITGWRSSDFACRDIVVFTDGLEGEATEHEKEELYYLLENSGYPVYVVFLEQDNNAAAKKSLSAICVTSGGRLFETEFEGSDAGVDRQITEKIYAAMDEYSVANWSKYEEEVEEEMYEEGIAESPEDAELSEESVEADEYMSQFPAEGKVIYEYDRSPGFFEAKGTLVLAGVILLTGILTALVIGLVASKKRRKQGAALPVAVSEDDEEYFGEYELGTVATSDLVSDLPGNEAGDTVLLSGDTYGDDGATRLLSEGPVVTLTDKDDRARSFRILLSAPMSIGRGRCDVVITGDDALSKRHCELFSRSGKVFVKDLSSANGTKVNKVKIEEESLADMDELTIGARTYIVGIA